MPRENEESETMEKIRTVKAYHKPSQHQTIQNTHLLEVPKGLHDKRNGPFLPASWSRSGALPSAPASRVCALTGDRVGFVTSSRGGDRGGGRKGRGRPMAGFSDYHGGVSLVRGHQSLKGCEMEVLRLPGASFGSIFDLESFIWSFGCKIYYCETRESAEMTINRLRHDGIGYVCYALLPDSDAKIRFSGHGAQGEQISFSLDYPPPCFMVVYNPEQCAKSGKNRSG